MFAWLKRRFGKDRLDLYTPKERAIFSYFDGQGVVKADPLVLYKRLVNKAADIDIDRKVAASEHNDAVAAHTRLAAGIREIFSVQPLAEGGLTETEAIMLLDQFIIYIEDVKKKSNLPASSPNSSAASGPSSAGCRPMPSMSASTSTGSGPSTAKPEPSLSASASPLG